MVDGSVSILKPDKSNEIRHDIVRSNCPVQISMQTGKGKRRGTLHRTIWSQLLCPRVEFSLSHVLQLKQTYLTAGQPILRYINVVGSPTFFSPMFFLFLDFIILPEPELEPESELELELKMYN